MQRNPRIWRAGRTESLVEESYFTTVGNENMEVARNQSRTSTTEASATRGLIESSSTPSERMSDSDSWSLPSSTGSCYIPEMREADEDPTIDEADEDPTRKWYTSSSRPSSITTASTSPTEYEETGNFNNTFPNFLPNFATTYTSPVENQKVQECTEFMGARNWRSGVLKYGERRRTRAYRMRSFKIVGDMREAPAVPPVDFTQKTPKSDSRTRNIFASIREVK